MWKRLLIGFVAGATLVVVIGFGASKLQNKRSDEEEYRAELADATPFEQGLLTQQQRIHSRLYPRYREMADQMNDYKTVGELVAHAKSKFREIHVTAGLGAVLEKQSPESYFGELARASDAIVRGRVSKKTSRITEDEAFVFTDYDFLVEEIFKNNAAALIGTGSTITVTRPGGKIVLNGVIMKALDDSFGWLPTNGNEVVLFMRFVADTGAYKPTSATGAFELDGSSVRPLTAIAIPPGALRDASALLGTIRDVSSQ